MKNKREICVSVYLTQEENSLVSLRVKESGGSLSAYLRDCILLEAGITLDKLEIEKQTKNFMLTTAEREVRQQLLLDRLKM